MDLAYLRQATRAEHEGTEDTVPLMQPDLSRAVYVETLQRMYTAVSTWDTWSLQHAPQHHKTLLEGRQRSTLLAADLGHLGSVASKESAPVELPREPVSDAEFLGRMYVMEGSTLGGQYIAKHVEEVLGLTPGEGDAYFRGYDENTGSMWNAFKAVLAQLPDEDTEAVVEAAKKQFGFFGACMSPEAVVSK